MVVLKRSLITDEDFAEVPTTIDGPRAPDDNDGVLFNVSAVLSAENTLGPLAEGRFCLSLRACYGSSQGQTVQLVPVPRHASFALQEAPATDQTSFPTVAGFSLQRAPEPVMPAAAIRLEPLLKPPEIFPPPLSFAAQPPLQAPQAPAEDAPSPQMYDTLQGRASPQPPPAPAPPPRLQPHYGIPHQQQPPLQRSLLPPTYALDGTLQMVGAAAILVMSLLSIFAVAVIAILCLKRLEEHPQQPPARRRRPRLGKQFVM